MAPLTLVRVLARVGTGTAGWPTEVVANESRCRSSGLGLGSYARRRNVLSEKEGIPKQKIRSCPRMAISATPASKFGFVNHNRLECVMFREDGNSVDEHDKIRPVELVKSGRGRHGVSEGVSSGHPRGQRVDSTGTFRRSERTVGLEDQRS